MTTGVKMHGVMIAVDCTRCEASGTVHEPFSGAGMPCPVCRGTKMMSQPIPLEAFVALLKLVEAKS